MAVDSIHRLSMGVVATHLVRRPGATGVCRRDREASAVGKEIIHMKKTQFPKEILVYVCDCEKNGPPIFAVVNNVKEIPPDIDG